MEIEDKLKEAADWRPRAEMPLGLERRALSADARPPLRPIGLTRPRSILLATTMAAAVCGFILMQNTPPERVYNSPRPSAQPTTSPQAKPVSPPNTPLAQKTKKPAERRSAPGADLVNEPPARVQTRRARSYTGRRSPLTQRLPVAVDTQSDSVKTGTRVAVEAPLYTPAYYAEPSADGQSVRYTPVALSVSDPDVIYSETNSEN